VRKRRPSLCAQLSYSTQTPTGVENRTGARPAPRPGTYTVRRAEQPAALPLRAPCGTRDAETHLVGQLLRPRGSCHPTEPHETPIVTPAAVATRPFGPRRPLWGARDRSRGRLHHPPSRESVRGLSSAFPGADQRVTPSRPLARHLATRGLAATCAVRCDGSTNLLLLAPKA